VRAQLPPAAAAAFTLTLALALMPALASADNHVRVKGTTRIDAHAARSAGRLVVSGTVIDDTARPVAGARVLLTFTRAASTVPLLGASADACSEGGARPVLERADALTLPSDDAARFCVRLTLPVDRYVARLESHAPGLYDDARLELAVDLALAPLTLRFDPERAILPLDDDKTLLEVIASTEDDGVTVAAVDIPLTLSNEAGTPIGTAMTNGSGRARFSVDSARLGPPGRGELRVAFAGGADSGPSAHTLQVERRTRVDLSAPEAHEERLPPGVPEDGVKVLVLAVPRCASHGCTGQATGTIEARIGDAIVGAASLEGGETHLVATFAATAGTEVPLRLRYVPDAPWLLPGGDLGVTLPLKPPAPWKKVPLALAAFVAIAWLVLARLPQRRPAAGRPSKHPPAVPEAGVHLVRQAPVGHGWGGRLHDAHDGFPIAGGRVAVERPGFERVAVMAQALTDAAGAFVLPPVEVRPGDVLAAEGAFHAALRRPLPPAGELDVALVLRRRAVLDRLVAWARRRGRPFDARPEPTPGQVRRAGATELPIARWADAVERAAYGGAPVDARAQAEVERLEPPDRPEPADPPGNDARGRRGPPGPR
jgi:hypothetical protein